jgi:sugar (pentulose or hexulose) kinase
MIFLGVDCGASALKAALVDESERIIAASSRNYRPNHPHPSGRSKIRTIGGTRCSTLSRT